MILAWHWLKSVTVLSYLLALFKYKRCLIQRTNWDHVLPYHDEGIVSSFMDSTRRPLGWVPWYSVAGYWLKETIRSQNQISWFLSSGLIWNWWRDVAFLWSRRRKHTMPNLCLTAHIRICYRFSKHKVAAIAITFNPEVFYSQCILLLKWMSHNSLPRHGPSWEQTVVPREIIQFKK